MYLSLRGTGRGILAKQEERPLWGAARNLDPELQKPQDDKIIEI